MALQRVPINNFRGGLNTRDSPFELQPNESPDLLNVTLTDLVGLLQVRKGMTRFDSNCPGTVDNAKMIQLSGQNPTLMCSVAGNVYSCSPGGFFTLRFTGTTNFRVWDFAEMPDASGNDRVWMCDGASVPQKWDGAAGSTSAWAGTPPVTMSRILVWKSKMVAINTGATGSVAVRVFLSKTGDPEQTTGAFDTLDLRGDDDDLETLTDMNVLADRLFVFKRRSTWIVTDPSTLANRRLGEPGCFGPLMSDVCDGKLYFFNEQGLWSTGGVAVAYESGSINSFFITRFNVGQISRVRVLATRDSYPRLLVTLPVDNSAVNNAMLEVVPNINFRRIGGRRYLLLPAFMLHTIDASCLANFKTNVFAQWGIYGGRTSVTQLHQFFVGTSDGGTAISAHWKSSWMAIQGEEPFERIRRFNVELSGDAIVDVFKDFNVSPDFSATLPDAGSSTDNIWDNNPHTWDEPGLWDPGNQYRFVRVRPESRGRFHQVQFRTLPGGQPFQINAAELVVRGGKEH